MRKRWMLIGVAALVILALYLLIIWRTRPAAGPIDATRAEEIAIAYVRSSPFAEDVDTMRLSTTFRDDLQAYAVDLAWKGARQVEPGAWSRGYIVHVSRQGKVIEAFAYER